jgi:PPK2 family polyphosphate:nucleotide phosphotransferase
MLSADILKRYRVIRGDGFRLASVDPADIAGLDMKKSEAEDLLASGVKRLAALQERLYAEHRWALLAVLQGLDAAGKDGVVKHVMSGVNPMGCEVHAFKAPSQLELDHDFLWRAAVALPRRGHIGIFNRSYYEEVLVVRVHPDLLQHEDLPPVLVTDNIWKERYQDIVAFERHLARSGTVPIKFFLHISRNEQRKRLLARLDEPEKQWKFNLGDLDERKLWPQYMVAIEEMIRGTASEQAPWYVVPADHKWFARLVVAAALVHHIEALDPKMPTLDAKGMADLDKARSLLANESGRKG